MNGDASATYFFSIVTMNTPGAVLLAPSPASGDKAELEQKYDAMYYLKGAAAGGICCSITHGALTPVDVVVRPQTALSVLKHVESYTREKTLRRRRRRPWVPHDQVR